MSLLPAGSIWTNVFVTVAVSLFVFLLPTVDLALCKRVGISPQKQTGTNPHAKTLLQVRQIILYAMLALYLALFSYMVFFSRNAAEEYRVNTELFDRFAKSLEIDLGVFELFAVFALEGPMALVDHIRIVNLHDFAEIYLNIMLTVPAGYLLPYVFRWFRAKVHIRPVVACFFMSLFTENIQLVCKVGFYDLDDLITNTLGGLVGSWLFMAFAYVVTNPNWRKDLTSYRKWKKRSRKRALPPFARSMSCARTVLRGTIEDTVREFYVNKLGYHMVGQVLSFETAATNILFKLGDSYIEVRCTNELEELPRQFLDISARNLEKVRNRLQEQGVACGPIEDDDFPGVRRFSFEGPDNVCVSMLESYVG